MSDASAMTPESLLPHEAPMLLLDELISADLQGVEARVHITPQSPFYDDALAGVPVWVGIEYMAQTIGVWEALRQREVGKKMEVALLLGIRSYQPELTAADASYNACFPKGASLSVEIAPALFDEDSRLGVFDCQITSSQIQVAAKVNAFSPDDPVAFINTLEQKTA